ncbi:MAG: serine hydroxymethyltransferase [Candidatus Geothermarchaeota archaeon]
MRSYLEMFKIRENISYEKIRSLLQQHSEFFCESIPLIASENIVSPAVKEALISDFGHRYAEGWPGERVYAGCQYIDQVELITIELMKTLFDAEFVDVRPISGLMANLAVYTAFTEPGDTMMALSVAKGGHISMGRKEFGGTAGAVRGLNVEYFEFDERTLNIDVDLTKKKIEKLDKEGKRIKLAMFGGSVILFPHPVKELSDFLKAYNVIVAYDIAHVAGLVAGGAFPNPLKEGTDVVTMSTHKTFFGPQRGAIASFNKYSSAIKKAVFPGLVSNHHLNTLAGLAIAALEMLMYGKEYAKNVIKCAKKLAEALYNRGFDVLGADLGFTQTHQVLIDTTKYGLGGDIEKLLEKAGIIVNRNLLPNDPKRGLHYENPGGIRLGVQEVVRLGMDVDEMEVIADFFKDVIIEKEDPLKVRERVKEFRKEFQEVKYTFKEGWHAHKFIKLTD